MLNKENALKKTKKQKKKIASLRTASEMETNLNKVPGTWFHRFPGSIRAAFRELSQSLNTKV